eukprot:COSAG01_NODE_6733_length_3524_cov_2.038832_5_plen_77_part_00
MERETLRLPFTRPLAVTQPPYTPGESAPKISELARHGTAAPTVGLSTNRRKTSRRKLEGGGTAALMRASSSGLVGL